MHTIVGVIRSALMTIQLAFVFRQDILPSTTWYSSYYLNVIVNQ